MRTVDLQWIYRSVIVVGALVTMGSTLLPWASLPQESYPLMGIDVNGIELMEGRILWTVALGGAALAILASYAVTGSAVKLLFSTVLACAIGIAGVGLWASIRIEERAAYAGAKRSLAFVFIQPDVFFFGDDPLEQAEEIINESAAKVRPGTEATPFVGGAPIGGLLMASGSAFWLRRSRHAD